jgi:hypothetical protein
MNLVLMLLGWKLMGKDRLNLFLITKLLKEKPITGELNSLSFDETLIPSTLLTMLNVNNIIIKYFIISF